MTIYNGNNAYPTTTDFRAHLKGIERAEKFLIDRRQQKIHTNARRAMVAAFALLVAMYLIGGVL